MRVQKRLRRRTSPEVLRERVLPARHALEPARTEPRVVEVRALGADKGRRVEVVAHRGHARIAPGELEDLLRELAPGRLAVAAHVVEAEVVGREKRVHVSGEGSRRGRRHAELVDLHLIALLGQLQHQIHEVQALPARACMAEQALRADDERSLVRRECSLLALELARAVDVERVRLVVFGVPAGLCHRRRSPCSSSSASRRSPRRRRQAPRRP